MKRADVINVIMDNCTEDEEIAFNYFTSGDIQDICDINCWQLPSYNDCNSVLKYFQDSLEAGNSLSMENLKKCFIEVMIPINQQKLKKL